MFKNPKETLDFLVALLMVTCIFIVAAYAIVVASKIYMGVS